jgi:hypothetical protein
MDEQLRKDDKFKVFNKLTHAADLIDEAKKIIDDISTRHETRLREDEVKTIKDLVGNISTELEVIARTAQELK